MKKWLALLLSLCLLFSFTACDESASEGTPADASEWVICWYLCGSDLETNHGCATTDLSEMLQIELPENVKVVIETGGSAVWQNDFVDATKIQRYVYDNEGLKLVDEQPSANMGDANTLAEFLTFAKENYPAEKTAVVFWNHGGGSTSGAAFDELYGNDSLSLTEMRQAFTSVWTPDSENQPLELIGFDTCLMATVDVTATFADLGKYLTASEEVEPGNGWLYSGWIGALAEDSSMDGLTLGKTICDTYYAGCEAAGTADSATLSLTDLSKVSELLSAYEAFGNEAFSLACEDPGFFALFARAAFSSENYGGNTREQGYSNMVDLGHLARLSKDILPQSADAVLSALDECVLYKVNGPYRSEATGLSCYYSYDADLNNFAAYQTNGTGEAFKHYFSYGLTGDIGEGGAEYLQEMEVETLPEVSSLADLDWNGMPLTLDENGNSVLTLGPDAYNVLSSIGFQLYYDDGEGSTYLLGTDNDIVADWDNGIFTDNFRAKWGALDGELVYMELSYEGDDYNLYSVPILLNGESYNLLVVYDFTTEEWTIQGARKPMDESGMADKDLRLLTVDDEITILHYSANAEGGFDPIASAIVTVSADTSFAEADLFDGFYTLIFEMKDAQGNAAYSAAVSFEYADGEIWTTID